MIIKKHTPNRLKTKQRKTKRKDKEQWVASKQCSFKVFFQTRHQSSLQKVEN